MDLCNQAALISKQVASLSCLQSDSYGHTWEKIFSVKYFEVMVGNIPAIVGPEDSLNRVLNDITQLGKLN